MHPIQIVEVGPRDGLQNESGVLAPEVRAELVNRLAAAGIRRLEAVSFVNPARVPAMAGAEEVMAGVRREPGLSVAGLVLNERGLERALAAGVDEVRYAFPVTETFAQRNQGSSVAEGLALALRLIPRVREAGLKVGVTLSTAFGCPFEGRVNPVRVLELAEQVAQARPDELLLADTIGVAAPPAVRELISQVAQMGVTVGGHFHNTRNTGYANALAALDSGATVLDASIGGLGGCPFAPGATGNVATEDLLYVLQESGVQTGLELDPLRGVAAWLAQVMGRQLPGQVYRAGGFPERRQRSAVSGQGEGALTAE